MGSATKFMTPGCHIKETLVIRLITRHAKSDQYDPET